MNDVSRRKFVTTGLAVAAGASGIGVAAKIAQHQSASRPMREYFTAREKR